MGFGIGSWGDLRAARGMGSEWEVEIAPAVHNPLARVQPPLDWLFRSTAASSERADRQASASENINESLVRAREIELALAAMKVHLITSRRVN